MLEPQEVFAVVRAERGVEWLDASTVRHTREGTEAARDAAEREAGRGAGGREWLKNNPFRRIGQFRLIEAKRALLLLALLLLAGCGERAWSPTAPGDPCDDRSSSSICEEATPLKHDGRQREQPRRPYEQGDHVHARPDRA